MLRLITLFAFTIVFLTASSASGQRFAPSDVVTDLYLARDDGGKAGERASDFRITDVPIYCVVRLNVAAPTLVKMNLMAVRVAGVRPETRIVSTAYTTKPNEDQVNFTGRPAGKWNAGTYRADIYIDGALAARREFIVRDAPAPVAPCGRRRKAPLRRGRGQSRNRETRRRTMSGRLKHKKEAV